PGSCINVCWATHGFVPVRWTSTGSNVAFVRTFFPCPGNLPRQRTGRGAPPPGRTRWCPKWHVRIWVVCVLRLCTKRGPPRVGSMCSCPVSSPVADPTNRCRGDGHRNRRSRGFLSVPGAYRVHGRLGPGMDTEFFQDAADVVLHRVLGDEQAFTDLAVVHRPRKEAQDIDLSGGQLRDHRGFGGSGFLFCQFGELTDEFGGHGGVDGRLSGHHGTDGARDVCHPDLLEEVPVGPG